MKLMGEKRDRAREPSMPSTLMNTIEQEHKGMAVIQCTVDLWSTRLEARKFPISRNPERRKLIGTETSVEKYVTCRIIIRFYAGVHT